jgi:hypothetical protein
VVTARTLCCCKWRFVFLWWVWFFYDDLNRSRIGDEVMLSEAEVRLSAYWLALEHTHQVQ